MQCTLLLQNVSTTEQRQPSDALINVVSLTVEFDLFICAFYFFFLDSAIVKFSSGYLQDTSADVIKLISHTLIYNLLEKRGEEINAPVENDQTFDVSIILIDFDLV